jgi:hypothetical protein
MGGEARGLLFEQCSRREEVSHLLVRGLGSRVTRGSNDLDSRELKLLEGLLSGEGLGDSGMELHEVTTSMRNVSRETTPIFRDAISQTGKCKAAFSFS